MTILYCVSNKKHLKKERSGIVHIYIIVSYWLRIDKNIYIRLKSSKFYMLFEKIAKRVILWSLKCLTFVRGQSFLIAQ